MGTNYFGFFSIVVHTMLVSMYIKVDKIHYGYHYACTRQDLKKELHGEISGSFRVAILGLCQTPAEFDANELRKAMKVHSGTSPSLLY